MDHPKRLRSGSPELEEDTFETKRSRTIGPLPQLPPEMWELIFRNLGSYWLRTVRLVCSSWNQIVRGSPRLMAKFSLTLTTENFRIDRTILRKFLASAGGYTRATLALFGIGINKPRLNWLKPLGTTLQTLSLELTGTEVFLTQLLREMPHLKQLNLKANSTAQFQDVTPDIRLEKLTELTISHNPKPNVLSYCRQVCSNLTVLKLFFLNSSEFDDEIISIVRANSGTLQELMVNVSQEIVDYLVVFEDLHLNRLSVGEAITGSVYDVLRLIEHQPDLEELNVMSSITIPNFYEIISALPKLRNLEVDLEPQDTQQTLSLKNLSLIESLTINYGGYFRTVSHPLVLTNCDMSRVRQLSLYQCSLSRELLSELQRTNISRLILKDCWLERLADLLLLKSLNHVELSGVHRIRDLSEPPVEESNGSSIRSLKVSRVDPKSFTDVVKIFPNLERFEGDSGASANGDVLQALSERSPLLKELRIYIGFFFNDRIFRSDVKRFGALKTIRVQCYDYERTTVTYALCGCNATFELYKVAPENESF